MSDAAAGAYTTNDLQVLSDREHVRARPAMYIGSTSFDGLMNLVDELLMESLGMVPWHRAMMAPIVASDLLPTRIDVTVGPNDEVVVEDDGIWSGVLPDLSRLVGNSTKNGRYPIDEAYQTHAGLHISSVYPIANFLSSWCAIEIEKDGSLFQQSFARGVPTSELCEIGPVGNRSGVKLVLAPDDEIFSDHQWDNRRIGRLSERLRELAMLSPMTFSLTDLTESNHSPVSRFARTDLAQGLTERLVGAGGTPSKVVEATNAFPAECWSASQTLGGRCEVALQVSPTGEDEIHSYVNLRRTKGGAHVAGLREAWRSWWFAQTPQEPTSNPPPVAAIVSVFHPSPMFEGATRDNVSNAEIESAVRDIVADALADGGPRLWRA